MWLFHWGDLSCYLGGNPSNVKNFIAPLLNTKMKKENKVIWVTPTEEFYNNELKYRIEEREIHHGMA